MDRSSQYCIVGCDQNHPKEKNARKQQQQQNNKKMQEDKMVV